MIPGEDAEDDEINRTSVIDKAKEPGIDSYTRGEFQEEERRRGDDNDELVIND